MVKRSKSSLLSLRQLSEGIKNGDISPLDLIEVCLDRIKKFDPILNAFISVFDEKTLYEQAQIAEKEIKQGQYHSPLHGIPFSIKDIFYADGIRCTMGSKIFSDNISHVDATAVKRLKRAGAILIGTNNLNEFASGITGINYFYGSSKNPWDTSRISGGSSGGSAVAVATGMVPFSLGTDTGGSIRVPSSLCGVVGIKPTFGRVSKHNVFPLSPSLDHVGCITRSAWDTSTVMQYISGWDPLDESSTRKKVPDYTKTIENSSIKGIRIGIPRNYFLDHVSSQVESLFYECIEILESAGSVVLYDFDLHDTDHYQKTWQKIRLAETAEIHTKWLKTRAKEYSQEVRQMLVQGTKISAVEYISAANMVRKLRKEFLSILGSKVDVLMVPTTIIPAPKFDEESIVTDNTAVLHTREALLQNTILFNCIGLPAISIPIGLTKGKMPIAAQIIGPPLMEGTIMSMAYNYECINDSLEMFIPPILS
ncbi:MAG TPA: amidase [Nitrososphaeraceae archaeon]|nr:amidase [Nitrososphaeraceae archaeon]